MCTYRSVTLQAKAAEEEDLSAWDCLDTWGLDGAAGRRFAALNGDINPMHIHPITARLLGFRTPIAHGQYITALCLAALQRKGNSNCAAPGHGLSPTPHGGHSACSSLCKL